MFWEKCNIGYFNAGSKELVKISGLEVQNNKPFWVYISKEAFDKIQNGVSLSTALKDYSLEIKEFLISGFAPTENSIFSFQRDPIQTAFVTNAVANSVVFYALAYLNNKGLSPTEIKNLRIRYSFENLEKRFFNMEELKHSFVNQSAFFLNLYKEMNENDRFEHFAENLEQQNRFKEIFKNYNDFISLKRQYNRRIFHNNLECDYMRSDYNEETFHKNTGVFSEKKILKDQHYYVIDEQYLNQLNMRLCKICAKSSIQNTDENENNDVVFEFTPTSNINSINISLPSEVKIFENENFIVTTDFDQFKNQTEKWLLEHPHLSEDKKLLDLISGENEKHSKIDAITLSSANRLSSRLEYRVADLLQNGACKVFNKNKNEFVKNIEMREYNFLLGELIGEGGRNFLADGEIFFSVEDWIS